MVRRVTIDDIRKINDIYYECHNYAAVARQTGFSAATVRSYVDKNYNPVTEDKIHRFDVDTEMPEFSTEMFVGLDNYGELCVLSDEEFEEIKQLWEEIAV